MSQPPDAEQTPSVPQEPDPRRWSILAVVVIAQLMVVLDASIVTIALPSAQRSLHISVANRQWVITAYTLAFGGLLLLGGRIADFGGRKRMFVVGLIGFAGASALGGLATDQALLFGARALQGGIGRAHGAGRPVDPHHHLPIRPRGAGQGLRRLRSRLRRRGRHRGPGRGRPHPVRVVALVPARQRAHRHHRCFAASRVVHESRAGGATRYDLPGAILSTAGTGQPGLRLHQGGVRRLGVTPPSSSWPSPSCCSSRS